MERTFALLGSVRSWHGGTEVDLGPPQQRAALAVLLLERGQLVTMDALAAALWGDDIPSAANSTVRTYVHRLRRLLGATNDDPVIRSVSKGYSLAVEPDAVDLLRFRSHVAQSLDLRSTSAPAAIEELRAALTLWQGAPLAGANAHFVRPYRQLLTQERSAAVELLAVLEIENGQHRSAIRRLRDAVITEPLQERLHELLITALFESGRQAEALMCYETARRGVAEGLGVDPGPRLRDLHQRILQSDGRAAAVCLSPPQPARPAQLPADLPSFVGRHTESEGIQALLPDRPEQPLERTTVVLVHGPAAVGKTTFAVRCAHRLAERFPDGQLYVNLHGFAENDPPADPADVIRSFLGALGVAPRAVPVDLNGQAALYRSLLADRRCLIVLDNAHDSAQVLPLLPGKPCCLVLVTSRHHLPGLVTATSAHTVALDMLSDADSLRLLSNRLGAQRVAREPDATARITARCGRLPLALALACARALSRPHLSLSALAAELSDADGSLDAFSYGDTTPDLRGVFSWSYRSLRPAAARLFHQLAEHPGNDITPDAAASLTALPLRTTRALLRELADVHLLSEQDNGRYARHDLLRAYTNELVEIHETPLDRETSLHRLLNHYLSGAYRADELLSPHEDRMAPLPILAGVVPSRIDDYDQAIAWFTAEYPVLLALVERAASSTFPEYAWQLAWTMRHFQHKQGYLHDLEAIQRTALRAAERQLDRTAMAHLHRSLARAASPTGRQEEAKHHLTRAFRLFEGMNDKTRTAYARRQGHGMCQPQDKTTETAHQTRQALALFRESGSAVGETAILTVGWSLVQDRPDESMALGYQAAAILQQHGERFGAARAWEMVGYLHRALGRHDDAIRHSENAITLFHWLGGLRDEADVLVRLREVYQAMSRPVEANAVLEQLRWLNTMLAGHCGRRSVGAPGPG